MIKYSTYTETKAFRIQSVYAVKTGELVNLALPLNFELSATIRYMSLKFCARIEISTESEKLYSFRTVISPQKLGPGRMMMKIEHSGKVSKIGTRCR